MNNDILYRIYKPGDELGIVKLLQETFITEQQIDDHPGRECFNIDCWHWKYKMNPAGFFPDLIGVAELDGEIVGHEALQPVIISHNGNKVMVVQSMDSATAKRARRRGIFQNLVRIVTQNAEKRRIPLIFGFVLKAGLGNIQDHKGASYKGFTDTLLWQVIDYFTRYIRICNKERFRQLPTSVLKKKALLAVSHFKKVKDCQQGIEISEISLSDNRLDVLAEEIANSNITTTYRDRKFLGWRLAIPNTKYKLIGAFVDNKLVGIAIMNHSHLSEGHGSIADLMTTPSAEDSATALAVHAREEIMNDVGYITFKAVPNRFYNNAMSAAGFIRTSTNSAMIVYNIKSDKKHVDATRWSTTAIETDTG